MSESQPSADIESTSSGASTSTASQPATTSQHPASAPSDAPASTHEAGSVTGLLVDWGGVMTTNMFSSFRRFCEAENLDPNMVASAFRKDPAARELLISLEEGRVSETDFEVGLGQVLGLESAEGLIDRLFSGATLDDPMVAAVRAARRAGVRTGLISNSWGTTRYPRTLLAELFDGLVISGEVGVRKPAPRIYELGAQAIGVDPTACVFVDDLPFNLPPAQKLGMAVVHHTQAETTITELERLLGMPLAAEHAAEPA